ncbi:SURF1 family protein [Vibrio sp. WXL210]|uniref:SURF1 family protein n=1 Tax=Vibrio sp. WXL210 TaxID=3450709 RepID=UPI003EC7ABC7
MTKAVLNKKTIIKPRWKTLVSGKVLFAVVFTVVVFSLLVKLGLWQLERGYDKQEIESTLAQRAEMPPVALERTLSISNPTGFRVNVEGRAIAEHYVLLDNQTWQGKVGYLAYQVIEAHDRYWLVERGFVSAPPSREVLPQVDWLRGEVKFVGRVYRRSLNPLSSQLSPEFIAPYRIQNLNLDQLSRLFDLPIEANLIQPQVSQWPYPMPWNPLPLPSRKHFGYAVQWFAMASVLFGLVAWCCWRAIRLNSTATKEAK